MKIKKSNTKLNEKIIEKWKTSKLNSITVIAKEFDISVYKVHTIINNYLTSKVIK